ncbi:MULTISPECIES: glycosyltransferase family 1 protein [Cyanophyceae]|uniref:glycosyltransferase family 4 protein n=1 Tax=Cyanophyceae TaxID=3028117 RepID=UPI000810D10D|nr:MULTISPECIES: glycosyltransferase family 1 protein [Cyanophyceae]ANV91384.1 mannosyltransferase [Picosynechococcus sp. PCC 8807]SMH49240.1 Glycosyltransferase involved in cell wall bisynthesis [Picosynechococcus sp. OG1]SMQ81539.1 Glycosyltransferase involved in cell wall bisynthesis [Synechococcus sp. 7002]
MILVNLSILSKKPTGISIYARNILPSLSQLNSKFLVCNFDNRFTTFNSYLIPKELSPDFGLKGHFKRLYWTQFALPKIYQKLESNLIFSPLPESPIYTTAKTVVMVHDLIPLRYPDKRSPLHYYQKFVLPIVLDQSKHIICNSQATADDLMNFFNISATKITPIYLAYNPKNFYMQSNKSKSKKPYFLYLGRHNPHKNLPRMIKAFSLLKDKEDYEFWLIGPKDKRYTPQLIDLVKNLELENQVLFKDYVSFQDLPMILNQAFCLMFVSLWEGFGLPLLEAMACGLPVITSNQSSLVEVAKDSAILVDPKNVQEIRSAMERITKDDNLYADLMQKGLQRASMFSWEKTGQETRQILRNLS